MVAHDIVIHKHAEETLSNLDPDLRDRITGTVMEIAEGRQPTAHPKCEQLDGNPLLKARVGDYRVLIDYQRTGRLLRVVSLGERATVYDNLDTAIQRAKA